MYNPKALAVAPELSKGTTKGLRVIISCVLKSNFFRPQTCSCTFSSCCYTKHCENVAVISSSNNLLYLMYTGSQLRHLFYFTWSRHLFYFTLEARIYCKNEGFIEIKGSMGNRTPANSQSCFSILLVYGLNISLFTQCLLQNSYIHPILVNLR